MAGAKFRRLEYRGHNNQGACYPVSSPSPFHRPTQLEEGHGCLFKIRFNSNHVFVDTLNTSQLIVGHFVILLHLETIVDRPGHISPLQLH